MPLQHLADPRLPPGAVGLKCSITCGGNCSVTCCFGSHRPASRLAAHGNLSTLKDLPAPFDRLVLLTQASFVSLSIISTLIWLFISVFWKCLHALKMLLQPPFICSDIDLLASIDNVEKLAWPREARQTDTTVFVSRFPSLMRMPSVCPFSQKEAGTP
jgi:hypothetical protein